ncbi:MRP-L47-domain-containing protein, partial [Rhodotorula sp. JG-1b]
RPKRIPTYYGQHAAAHPQPDPAQRPTREETDTSNHPLWRFFHDQQSLESLTMRARAPGRSWTAPELRLKSFTELHQLWYILLRERNVLLTQREEARRLRVDLSGYTAVPDKLRLCQKSMARIKQVISERRHAALQAAQILRERGQLAQAEQIEHEAKVAQ